MQTTATGLPNYFFCGRTPTQLWPLYQLHLHPQNAQQRWPPPTAKTRPPPRLRLKFHTRQPLCAASSHTHNSHALDGTPRSAIARLQAVVLHGLHGRARRSVRLPARMRIVWCVVGRYVCVVLLDLKWLRVTLEWWPLNGRPRDDSATISVIVWGWRCGHNNDNDYDDDTCVNLRRMQITRGGRRRRFEALQQRRRDVASRVFCVYSQIFIKTISPKHRRSDFWVPS